MECDDIHDQFRILGDGNKPLMEEMHILNFSNL